MIANKQMAKIFEFTPQCVGKWKKENRPIFYGLIKYIKDGK